jgi:5'-3' exonuclease
MFQILQDEPFKIHQCRDYQHRNRLWTPSRIKLELHGLEPKHIPQFMAYSGDKVDNIPGATRVRRPNIAAAIKDGCTPENIGDFILFSTKEINAIEEHVASGRYAKNLELVRLKIKDVEVIQRDWQPEEVGKWLRDMEFRTLKLCHTVGIEARIEEDEEF